MLERSLRYWVGVHGGMSSLMIYGFQEQCSFDIIFQSSHSMRLHQGSTSRPLRNPREHKAVHLPTKTLSHVSHRALQQSHFPYSPHERQES
jgi:hypothetical protein